MHPTAPKLNRGYASGPIGQIHYYDSEGDGEPLLLVHQSPTSALDFVNVFADLVAAKFRVIALDLPGLGMSDAPDTDTELVASDFADAVMAVLNHLEISRCDACGYHTGAAVIIAAAVKHPDRFGKLVLYGAPCLTKEERELLWSRIVPGERAGGVYIAEPDGLHLSRLFQNLSPRYGLDVANRMVLCRMMAGPTLWMSHNAALTHDMTPNLVADRHPLLLLSHAGEMLHANTQAAYGLRPDATMTILEVDCANAMDSVPEQWASAVVDFLRSEQRGGKQPSSL